MSESEEMIKKWMNKHSKLDMAKQLVNSQIALGKEHKRRSYLEDKREEDLEIINKLRNECRRENARANEADKRIWKSVEKISHLEEKCKRGGKLMTSAHKNLQNLETELQGVSADNIALLEELNQARNDKEALKKQLEIEYAYRMGRQVGKGVVWKEIIINGEVKKVPMHPEDYRRDDIPF